MIIFFFVLLFGHLKESMKAFHVFFEIFYGISNRQEEIIFGYSILIKTLGDGVGPGMSQNLI